MWCARVSAVRAAAAPSSSTSRLCMPTSLCMRMRSAHPLPIPSALAHAGVAAGARARAVPASLRSSMHTRTGCATPKRPSAAAVHSARSNDATRPIHTSASLCAPGVTPSASLPAPPPPPPPPSPFDSSWLPLPVVAGPPLPPLLARLGLVLGDVLLLASSGWLFVSVGLPAFFANVPEAAAWASKQDPLLGLMGGSSIVLLVVAGSAMVVARRIPFLTLPPPAAAAGSAASGSPLRVLLALVAGFGALVAFHALCNLTDQPLQEEPVIFLAGMDGRASYEFWIAGVAPFAEELLFRAFLLARWTRILGFPLAAVLTSLPFGLAHYSPESDKVLEATCAGLLFASVYAAARNFLAPVLLHTVNNAQAFEELKKRSPLLPMDQLAGNLQRQERRDDWRTERVVLPLKRALVRLRQQVGWVRPPQELDELQPAHYAYLWLQQDDLATLSAPAATVVHALFTALDRGNKGFLDASELAYALHMQKAEHALFNAALSAVQRHVAVGGDAVREELRSNLQRAPGLEQAVQLPSDDFFSPAHRLHAGASLSAALGATPSLLRRSLPSLPPALAIESAFHSSLRSANNKWSLHADEQQRELMRTYYAIKANAQYDVCGSARDGSSSSAPASAVRCTPADFSRLVSRSLLLHPVDSAAWLSRMARVLQGLEAHPMQQMWQKRMGDTQSTHSGTGQSASKGKPDAVAATA